MDSLPAPTGPFWDRLLAAAKAPPLGQEQHIFQSQFPPNLDNQQLYLLLLSLLSASLSANSTNSADFAKLSRDQEQIQERLAENAQNINAINQELMDRLETFKGKLTPRCRERRLNLEALTLSKGFVDVQESSLNLQSALLETQLRRRTAEGMGDLLKLAYKKIEDQKEKIQTLKDEANEEDESVVLEDCQEPFFLVGHECFFLSHEVKMSWHSAGEKCREIGSHLARPADVRSLVAALQDFPGKYNRVWIGASDLDQEGRWTWTSGDPLSTPDWRPGQPSNQTANYGEQDCLSLVTKNNQGATMDDHSCDSKRAFLCEMDLEC